MEKPITPAQMEMLERAAKRERGNLCPNRFRGHSETLILQALDRRGLIAWDGGTPFKSAPRINEAGRAIVAEAQAKP